MTLTEHRWNLANNIDAYIFDILNSTERVIKTLIPHLKRAGYSQITFTKHCELLREIIFSFFEAQEQRPIFHVEGTQLPLCWNRPADWDRNYIKYEWGHIYSINQNKGIAFRLENLGLYSARCNQHIQSSMDVQELMIYGGVLATRITNVLTKRRILFGTERWRELQAILDESK